MKMHLRWWCLVLVVLIGALLVFWCWPLHTVHVPDSHHPSTQVWLQHWQARCVGQSAWSCRSHALRQDQQKAPWVKHVASHRLGGGVVRWDVQEHQAVATWHRGGVFVTEGVWLPLAHEAVSDVPVLEGPDALKAQMGATWQRLQALWSLHVPRVSRVCVNRRGAWTLHLDQGIAVLLGSEQHEARVQRFVKSYGTVVSKRARDLAYVDLRYTEGMALGWRDAASGDPLALVQR